MTVDNRAYNNPQPDGIRAKSHHVKAHIERQRKGIEANKKTGEAIGRCLNTSDGQLLHAFLKKIAFSAMSPELLGESNGFELAHREGQRYLVALLDSMTMNGGS